MTLRVGQHVKVMNPPSAPLHPLHQQIGEIIKVTMKSVYIRALKVFKDVPDGAFIRIGYNSIVWVPVDNLFLIEQERRA